MSCDEYGAVDGSDVGSWEPELEFKTRCAPPPPNFSTPSTHPFSLLPSCLAYIYPLDMNNVFLEGHVEDLPLVVKSFQNFQSKHLKGRLKEACQYLLGRWVSNFSSKGKTTTPNVFRANVH